MTEQKTHTPSKYFTKYYGQLRGATVLHYVPLLEEGDYGTEEWPQFLLRLESGEEVWLTLSSDEEGNGPGFAFIEPHNKGATR
tara:strand:+ start:262 stop:510 length:249 start_codon:yes stop_codon:yes gene_type:complete